MVSFDTSSLVENVKSKFQIEPNINLIKKYSYKPFIEKYIYFDDKLIGRSRKEFMSNFISKNNIGICLMRNLVNTDSFSSILLTNNLLDINFYGFQTYCLPLYLYPETTAQQTLDGNTERTPNLNPEIVKQIAEGLGYFFSPEKPDYNEQTEETNQLYPIDILDYIYAVLHSPSYREKYKEFLKIDFPRVPYPKNPRQFIDLVELGSQLRQIHLLESPVVEDYITQYPEDGTNIVGKLYYEKTTETLGRVYINHDKTPPSGAGGLQYFENVPEVAWNFYIGGYQPAQKWLKDRKERELSYEDILHYQKIIVALSETDRIMKEIDKIDL